jgi:hypothetical protein
VLCRYAEGQRDGVYALMSLSTASQSAVNQASSQFGHAIALLRVWCCHRGGSRIVGMFFLVIVFPPRSCWLVFSEKYIDDILR